VASVTACFFYAHVTDAIYVSIGHLKPGYTIASTLPTTLVAFFLWLCSPSSALAEEWVAAGWQQISAKHDHQALEIWQQGVEQLDDKRLLASLGVFAHFPYAVDKLKQVGAAYGAFIVRRNQQGRVLYYVFSTRHVAADRNKRQLELAELKQAAGISGILLAVEAGTLKLQAVPTDYFHTAVARPVLKRTQAATAIMATAENSFSINRFVISGNQHVSTDIILMSLRDFYGADKTRADLQSIKNQIIEIYRMSDIDSVQVTMPQLIDDDTVRITISEH